MLMMITQSQRSTHYVHNNVIACTNMYTYFEGVSFELDVNLAHKIAFWNTNAVFAARASGGQLGHIYIIKKSADRPDPLCQGSTQIPNNNQNGTERVWPLYFYPACACAAVISRVHI